MPDEAHTNDETARPVMGASSVPREKPVIEGHAEEIEARDPAQSDSFNGLPAPPEGEATPAREPADSPQEPARAPRMVVWPFAAAAILAAILAIGGVLGLHLLDRRADRTALAALESRVGALERRPHANPARDGAATLEPAYNDLEASISGLRAELQNLASQKAAAAPDLAPLESRIRALEAKLPALDAKIGALADKLEAEKGQVSAAASRVSQSATARANGAALAVLSGNLLRKVESGAPYATELAALANLGFDKNKLAPLEADAASGLATPAALATQFAGLAPAILATAPQPAEHGFFDHLLKGAERLVRVQKIGELGNDLAGRVGRIQAALDSGAVEEAYKQWNDLPDAAKTRSEAFGVAAKARIDATGAAREINAGALAALAKARS